MTGVWIAAVLLASGCAGTGNPAQNGESAENSSAKKEKTVEMIASVSPVYGREIQQGQSVRIRYELLPGQQPDSVVLYMNNQRLSPIDTAGYEYAITTMHPTGRVVYKITAYKDGKTHNRTGEFNVLAARPPMLYGHKVIRSYSHDDKAYTQGLLWHDGHLYESTGLAGSSTLRKVDLGTGNVLQQKDLPKEYFGEGLALLNGKFYQLTWQNNKALVYDAGTFEKIGEFGYGGEGWGLTTDGTYLYMTDGSEKIAVLDPETFKRIRTIEVYTDRSRVFYLNELEWIKGELWANVYMTDNIIRIDPATGVVLGVIDLKGLLPVTDITESTDVLNGIAYDAKNGKIFVTGKNWRKLFEISVFEKGTL